jgi:hypothetical protein
MMRLCDLEATPRLQSTALFVLDGLANVIDCTFHAKHAISQQHAGLIELGL